MHSPHHKVIEHSRCWFGQPVSHKRYKGIAHQVQVSRQGKTHPVKPIMTPSVGHKLTLISGVAVGNIIINPVGTRIATSLTEDRGS